MHHLHHLPVGPEILFKLRPGHPVFVRIFLYCWSTSLQPCLWPCILQRHQTSAVGSLPTGGALCVCLVAHLQSCLCPCILDVPLDLCFSLVSIPISGSISFSSWPGLLDGSQTWFITCRVCHCCRILLPATGRMDPMGEGIACAGVTFGSQLHVPKGAARLSLPGGSWSKLHSLPYPVPSVAGMCEQWSEQA